MAGEIAKLMVAIGAEVDDFVKDMDKAFKTVSGQAKEVEKVGKSLTTYVTLPALAAGAAFVKMAADEEASAARLKNALTNVGVNFNNAKDVINTYISSLERASGFDDSSISDAFSNLTQITGNARLSVQALQATLDLARAKNMDLASASTLVGKALNGNSEALKRYGIDLQDGSKGLEVITALTAKFGGASETYIKSAAGQLSNLKNQAANAAEAWGNVLMPVAMKVVGILTALADKAQTAASWFSRLSPNTQAVVATLAAVVVAAGPMLVVFAKMVTLFTTLRPLLTFLTAEFSILAAEILFLAGIALVVAANWEKTGNLLKSIFWGVVSIFAFLVDSIIKGIAYLVQKIPGLGQVFGNLSATVGEFSNQMQQNFLGAAQQMDQGGTWMGNTVDFVGSKLNGLMSALALTGAQFGVLKTQQGAAADAMMGTAQQQLSTMQKWAIEMKKTVMELSTAIVTNMSQAMTGMVMALATGTADAKQLFFQFLLRTVEQLIEWAITSLFLAWAAAEGIKEALSNPYTAAAAIVIGLALVAAIGSAYKSSTAMADGGVVTGPTHALVGEAGPEAVIPLNNPGATSRLESMFGGGQGNQEIYIMLDGRTIAEAVVENFPAVLRLQAIGA